LFECGNIPTTLLILRATQLLQEAGRSATAAATLGILIYAAHNAACATVAYLGGRWIDRTGPRRVFAAGALLYVFAYLGFAAGIREWWLLLAAFCLAGGGIGRAETAESTPVAQILPDRLRGSGFGVIGAVQTGGNLIGTVVAGFLYALVSPTAAFIYAAVWMALSVFSAGAPRASDREHPSE
jgi:MFS family permease